MADAEKIRERLKICVEDGTCIDCDYIRHTACKHFLLKDAIKLIDDQAEDIKRLRTQLDEAMLWR